MKTPSVPSPADGHWKPAHRLRTTRGCGPGSLLAGKDGTAYDLRSPSLSAYSGARVIRRNGCPLRADIAAARRASRSTGNQEHVNLSLRSMHSQLQVTQSSWASAPRRDAPASSKQSYITTVARCITRFFASKAISRGRRWTSVLDEIAFFQRNLRTFHPPFGGPIENSYS